MDDSLKRRIEIALKLPLRYENQGGYWANSVSEFKVGSLLWTMTREKQTPETLLKIRQIVQEALHSFNIENIHVEPSPEGAMVTITIDNQLIKVTI